MGRPQSCVPRRLPDVAPTTYHVGPAMAFRFRKSFKLGPMRLNVSKKGLGASVGVPGARIGIGPRGTRLNVGLPGTGLGWEQRLSAGSGTASSRGVVGGQGSSGCLVPGLSRPPSSQPRQQDLRTSANSLKITWKSPAVKRRLFNPATPTLHSVRQPRFSSRASAIGLRAR